MSVLDAPIAPCIGDRIKKNNLNKALVSEIISSNQYVTDSILIPRIPYDHVEREVLPIATADVAQSSGLAVKLSSGGS